ncbi:SDR family NAD(P)-dependent oxidoreductase [Halalkalirubrum salinum]|uniref:SDR family NAD(P)-dependent oxidoreductase n=1 Tax=Halalkalirubrum salinum TaxID=2563889 RepID=UPI0010FB8B5C|nr:SDR family oxidoreductase [Halalkalirubrum salinum]
MVEEPSIAVITGGASGIGRATVTRFLEDDVYDLVACLDIAEDVEKRFEDESIRAFRCDVTDHDQVSETISELEGEGRIDAVVNNAGFSKYSWIGDLSPDEWREIIDINLTSQYNLAHTAAPAMYEREHGYLLNVSSGAGKRGSASGGVHYSAAKAGVFGLTKGLAKQLSPYVRVNCVIPGLVDTPLATDSNLWTETELEEQAERIPLKRLAQPDDVARVIHFLCDEGASYMTGELVTVDGGSSLS